MLPKNLEKSFNKAIETSADMKKQKFYETKEERLKRIMKQLGIQEHGKGKKKKNKKKGGKK